MSKRAPKQFRITEVDETPVDLEREVVILKSGRRLTNELADEIVDEVRAKAGRPSLGAAGTSPTVSFRLPVDLRAEAEALAEREGVTVSALARDALEARLRAS